MISGYEKIGKFIGMQCSFAFDCELSTTIIQNHWNQLMEKYPYCLDYEYTEGMQLESTTNEIYQINIQEKYQITSITEALNELIKENSFEVARTRLYGMNKSALLTYSLCTINNKCYTVLAMYICHSKTDFKSLVYLVEEFVSFFSELNDNKQPIETKKIPFESCYPYLVENNCIPLKENKEQIMKLIPKDVVHFDFLSPLRSESLDLTEEEKQQAEEEIKELIPNCIVSETMKLTSDETKKLVAYAKERKLSIQAVLFCALLKVFRKVLQLKDENMKTLLLMILYDVRAFSKLDEHCFGIFGDGVYPTYPLSFIEKPIEVMAQEMTEYMKTVSSNHSKEFDLFRYCIYHIDNEIGAVPYTSSLSNIGRFVVFDRVNESIRKHILDYHFSDCNRYLSTKDMTRPMIHTFLMNDGSCNFSMSYSFSVIPSIIIKKILNELHSLLISL